VDGIRTGDAPWWSKRAGTRPETRLASVGEIFTRVNGPLQSHSSINKDGMDLGNGSTSSPPTGHDAQEQRFPDLRSRNHCAGPFVVENALKSPQRYLPASPSRSIQARPVNKPVKALLCGWDTLWRRLVSVGVSIYPRQRANTESQLHQ
jgi:hypothetical protein